jgi:2-iminobutanoate/2-iminopropanoate deaminase
MPIILHNPDDVFPPYRSMSHGVEIRGDARMLIVSGLNGYQIDGKTLPESFEEQGELVWRHLGSILRSAGMGYGDIVSLRTYLAAPEYDEANVRLRVEHLGDHRPALTVVCCQLLDPRWKLELEATAAKG